MYKNIQYVSCMWRSTAIKKTFTLIRRSLFRCKATFSWIYETCGQKFQPETLLLKIWKNTPMFQQPPIGQSRHLSALKNAQLFKESITVV